MQELHCRNDELQTRIGNLEQILMARLAESRENAATEDDGSMTPLQAYAVASSARVSGGVDQHRPTSINQP